MKDILGIKLTDIQQGTNLTPHDLNIKIGDDEIIVKASGKTLRAIEHSEHIGEIGDIPVSTLPRFTGEVQLVTGFGKNLQVLNEPLPRGVVFTSSMTVDPLMRSGFEYPIFVPNTNTGAVRNDKGQITGTTELHFANYEQMKNQDNKAE